MAFKNRFWYGLFVVGFGWTLLACAPIHPVASVATPAPPEEPTAAPITTTLASPSWITLCDTDAVDGGEISFAAPYGAMVNRTWLNSGLTNDPFLFSQLTDLSIDDVTSIVPDAAQSWDESPDGLVYTYHLRPDVLWHDGEALTAEDVKWTIELYAHPDSDVDVLPLLPIAAIAGYSEFVKGSADNISGVKVLDDSTVQIMLTAPRADFLYGLSGLNLWPKHYFEGISFKEISASPKVREEVVGSGPFEMASYEPNQEYVLEANPAYFLGRPHLDRLIFRLGLLGPAAWLPRLESGEIQVGDTVTGADRARVEANPELTLVGAPVPEPTVIWPNHQRLTDRRVLQALLYAIDRQTIADVVYGPGEAIVFGFDNIDPQHTWISAGAAKYGYDPDKAKQLLAEAGWDANRELSLISYTTSDVEKDVIAAMQQYWADAGVKVNVEYISEVEWLQNIFANLDFDLAYGCCGVASPADYAAYSSANMPPEGINTAAYCNPEVDSLLTNAMTTVEPAKRQELWAQASEIINDEMLEIPLFQLLNGVAVSKDVCDFQYRQWSTKVWPERNPEIWFLRPES